MTNALKKRARAERDNRMSVLMALVDYVPVVLFLCTAVALQRSLYNLMSKGAFAVFSSGTIMVVAAGLFKASRKLLYAAGICDFAKLGECFFPMQSTGFFLIAAGLIALLVHPQKEKNEKMMAVAAAPAVFQGTMLFVGMMVAGIGVLCASLCRFAVKLGKKAYIIVFVLAFFFMLAMGYLSTKNFENPAMNWAAETVNILGQGCLLFGTAGLNKAGLAKLELGR